MIDETTGFVLNHIDASVGTRSKSNSAEVTYEIPAEVVAEAIINGCVHRSYESNGSILSDKHVTAAELAEEYGVDVRTVRRDFDKLRETYDIEWIPLTPTTGY